MDQTAKGQGLLYVSECVWPDLGWPETTKQWKAALLLPDGYEVEQVAPPYMPHPGEFALVTRREFTLYVRHQAIPEVIGASHLPVVTPYYYREKDRVVLNHIDISCWDGNTWHTIETQWMEGE